MRVRGRCHLKRVSFWRTAPFFSVRAPRAAAHPMRDDPRRLRSGGRHHCAQMLVLARGFRSRTRFVVAALLAAMLVFVVLIFIMLAALSVLALVVLAVLRGLACLFMLALLTGLPVLPGLVVLAVLFVLAALFVLAVAGALVLLIHDVGSPLMRHENERRNCMFLSDYLRSPSH